MTQTQPIDSGAFYERKGGTAEIADHDEPPCWCGIPACNGCEEPDPVQDE